MMPRVQIVGKKDGKTKSEVERKEATEREKERK